MFGLVCKVSGSACFIRLYAAIRELSKYNYPWHTLMVNCILCALFGQILLNFRANFDQVRHLNPN